MGDAVREDAGLAGAGSGDDEERPLGVQDRVALGLVEVCEGALGGRDRDPSMLAAVGVALEATYQRTVSSTCPGAGGAPLQVTRQVYVPFGSGSKEARQ